jgi:hypothetical protein
MVNRKYIESLNLGCGSIIQTSDDKKYSFLRLASQNDVVFKRTKIQKEEHANYFVGCRIMKNGGTRGVCVIPITLFQEVIKYEKPIDLSYKVLNLESELTKVTR